MSQITLADLVSTRVSISPQEAAALTLAVADLLLESGATRVPTDEHILLSSTGQVSFANATSEGRQEPQPLALTAGLAALTRRVLQLDESDDGEVRRRVPGGLLVLLARSLREIDLPPLALSAFRDALARFGSADATTLAGVFWRAARMRVPGTAKAAGATLPSLRVESALSPKSAAEDRRQQMPSATELRRYLREIERELYEARTAAPAIAPPLSTPGERAPARPSRLWRTGAAFAATVVGAAAGILAAFLLVGSFGAPRGVDGPQALAAIGVETGHLDARPASESEAVESAAGTVGEGAAAAPAAAFGPTARSGDPLLLPAAIGADVFSPSFAPVGRTLLFHAGRRAAPLMRATLTRAGTVGEVETLLDDGASNYHVTMSPDGRLIAFDSDREGVRGVYVANADGSRPTRISGARYAAVPRWSPTGDRLAFARAEAADPRVWNIWIADLASGRLQQITHHRAGQPWGASWFPDGRRIAYGVEDRLMVADLDSGIASGYRTPRPGHPVRTPAVSPDGRLIVFQVQRDGVWLLDVERARMRRLLDDATAEEFAWLPAGDSIAFHARRGGGYGVWRLSVAAAGS